jgi:hypothetical protein
MLFVMFRVVGNRQAVAAGTREHVAARAKLPEPKPETPDIKPDTEIAKAPEIKAPEIKAPEIKAPEIKAPEIKQSPKSPEIKQSPKSSEIKQPTKTPEIKQPTKTPAIAKTSPPKTQPAKQIEEITPTPIDRPEKKLRPDPEDTTPVADGCDEVSCVLDHYDRPCCRKFKPAEESLHPHTTLPEELDRGMVVNGIDKMKPVVIRCGEKYSVTGTVKLSVQVDGDGRVTNVLVTATPDAGLGSCVAAAIRKATFGKTQNGGSFKYPFVF